MIFIEFCLGQLQCIYCTFSDVPLQVGEMYCIGISGRTDITDWSGALRLGVTTEVIDEVI